MVNDVSAAENPWSETKEIASLQGSYVVSTSKERTFEKAWIATPVSVSAIVNAAIRSMRSVFASVNGWIMTTKSAIPLP